MRHLADAISCRLTPIIADCTCTVEDGEISEECSISITVTSRGRSVVEGVVSTDGDQTATFKEIWVDPAYRRRKIATTIYDAVESAGYRLSPSAPLDEEGELFWASRLSSQLTAPTGNCP